MPPGVRYLRFRSASRSASCCCRSACLCLSARNRFRQIIRLIRICISVSTIHYIVKLSVNKQLDHRHNMQQFYGWVMVFNQVITLFKQLKKKFVIWWNWVETYIFSQFLHRLTRATLLLSVLTCPAWSCRRKWLSSGSCSSRELSAGCAPLSYLYKSVGTQSPAKQKHHRDNQLANNVIMRLVKQDSTIS